MILEANVGLPMLLIQIPFLAMAFLPVAAVETVLYRFYLKIPWKEAFVGAFRANVASTLVGIPAAWLIQVLAQISIDGGRAWGMDSPQLALAAVTLQSAWLIPYEKEFHWMIPAASLVLLVPWFFASVGTEYLVLRRWIGLGVQNVGSAVWRANVLSYAGLAIFWATRLANANP